MLLQSLNIVMVFYILTALLATVSFNAAAHQTTRPCLPTGIVVRVELDDHMTPQSIHERRFRGEANVCRALTYLQHSPNAAHIIAALRWRIHPLTIIVNDHESTMFNGREGQLRNVLYWDEYVGLKYTDKVASPALGLIHEMNHAIDEAEDPQLTAKRYNEIDSQYDNAEERFTIIHAESPVARELGEPTRFSHGGTPICTAGPTSRIALNRPIFIGKRACAKP